MFRVIAIAILPLLAIIWQTLTETGGGGGQGSSQGSSGGGGQSGGDGASGSGGGSASGSGQSAAQGTGTAGTGFEGEYNPEQARALIDKLRPFETQAAQLQAKLTDAETQLAEFQAQGQSELQQATTKVANLEADKLKLQQDVRQLKVRVLGGEAGIVDTQAASLLLKWKELGDEPDDEKVKAALNQMVQDRPWLLGDRQPQQQETPGQNVTNGGRTGGGNGEESKPKPGRSRILAAIKSQAKAQTNK